MQVIGRPHEIASRRKVGRVDDERLSFPPTPGIPLQQADGLRQVRVPVDVVLLKVSIAASAARYTASPAAKSTLVFLKRRSARLRSSITSSSVSDARPSRAFGRSNGVALSFSQMPCRSGWPSGVSGGVHICVVVAYAHAGGPPA